MNHVENMTRNEEGYALVVALMIMAILSLIGVFGINTSIIEQQIAGNEWNAKRTFYRADGGVSLGSELLEQNIACATGFLKGPEIVNGIYAKNLSLYTNSMFASDFNPDPIDADALYPWDGSDSEPAFDVGYLYYGGQVRVLAGGALQMAAGYEGKGKSAAQGGTAREYDIYSQFIGPKQSETIIVAGWRHLIGSEGACIY